MSESIGEVDDAAPVLPDPPSPPEDDRLAKREEMDLSPSKHRTLLTREHIEHLKSEIKRHRDRENRREEEIARLRKNEVDLAAYKTKDRILRVVTLIGNAAAVAGGFMIESGDDSLKKAGFWVGGLGLLTTTLVSLTSITMSD